MIKRVGWIILGSVLLLVFLQSDAMARTLTLEQALARAQGDAPMVLAKEAATDAARADLMAATARLTPQLSVSETYLRTDNPVGVFAGKLNQGKFTATDFVLPSLNDPASINNWTTRIELNAPIIHSGVSWAQRRAAKENLAAQEHFEGFEQAQTAFAVKRLYYSAVALENQRAALGEGIRKLRNLESSYELLEEPTSASTTSYLVARSVRTNLEAQRVKVECEQQRALRDLNAILGFSVDDPVNLTDALPSVKTEMPSAEDAAGRQDVDASAAMVRAASAERDAAKRRWGPNVDFFGAYNVFTGNFQDAEGSYEVGARLSWPIIDLNRHAQIKRSRHKLQEAEQMHRAADLKAQADLKTARHNVQSCVERYGIVQQALGSASQAMQQATLRYKEGTLPLMDYSQAIQNWVQMKLHLIENHLQVALAKADYTFQQGTGMAADK